MSLWPTEKKSILYFSSASVPLHFSSYLLLLYPVCYLILFLSNLPLFFSPGLQKEKEGGPTALKEKEEEHFSPPVHYMLSFLHIMPVPISLCLSLCSTDLIWKLGFS